MLFTAYAIVRTVPSANRPNRRKKKSTKHSKTIVLYVSRHFAHGTDTGRTGHPNLCVYPRCFRVTLWIGGLFPRLDRHAHRLGPLVQANFICVWFLYLTYHTPNIKRRVCRRHLFLFGFGVRALWVCLGI